MIVTGNEVYSGLIQDRFEEIVRGKLDAYGANLVEAAILPDDLGLISAKVKEFLKADTGMIVTTGGMSVDPDDVTRTAIRMAGVDRLHYSAAVLPGAMFLLAYKNDIPVVGIPACGLYHKITIFDLVLPRLLAGENLDERDLAGYAAGGLCRDCPACRYPACSFGKGR
jgi:molybdopterin biosynthesis enzyme